MRSMVQALLLAAAARSDDQLHGAIARPLKAFSADDARGWFAVGGCCII